MAYENPTHRKQAQLDAQPPRPLRSALSRPRRQRRPQAFAPASRGSRGSLEFAGFRFDLDSQRLWRGDCEVSLKPKMSAMLIVFITQPERLISKDELLGSVWRNTHISPETLRSTLRELRHVLGDDAQAPQLIETVHGRGYRFIAPVQRADQGAAQPLVDQLSRAIELASEHAEPADLRAALEQCLEIVEQSMKPDASAPARSGRRALSECPPRYGARAPAPLPGPTYGSRGDRAVPRGGR